MRFGTGGPCCGFGAGSTVPTVLISSSDPPFLSSNPGPLLPRIPHFCPRPDQFRAKTPYFRARFSGSRLFARIYANRSDLIRLFCTLLLLFYLVDLRFDGAIAVANERNTVFPDPSPVGASHFTVGEKMCIFGILRRSRSYGPPLPAIPPGVFDQTGGWRR